MIVPLPTSRENRPVRVIGMDPGAEKCGWAILDVYGSGANVRYEYVYSYVHMLPKGSDKWTEYRRRLTTVWTDEFTGMLQFVPNVVCNELLPVTAGSPSAAQRILGMTVVVVTHTICHQQGIECVEYAANTIKKRVTGKGTSTKVKVRDAVLEIFPELLPRKKEFIKTPDETDAIATALVGAGYDCTS